MREHLSNRTFAIVFIILFVSWFLAQVTLLFFFPASTLPFSPMSAVAGIVYIGVLMGFLYYTQRLKDERTLQISDKAARNGFAFVLYGIPIGIVLSSLFTVPLEVYIILLLVWFGSVLSTGLSALYYYRK